MLRTNTFTMSDLIISRTNKKIIGIRKTYEAQIFIQLSNDEIHVLFLEKDIKISFNWRA